MDNFTKILLKIKALNEKYSLGFSHNELLGTVLWKKCFYMILFIKDLDNPFGYAQDEILTEEVSLKPLHDNIELIKTYIKS